MDDITKVAHDLLKYTFKDFTLEIVIGGAMAIFIGNWLIHEFIDSSGSINFVL